MAESVGGLCQECLQTEVTEFTPKIPPPPEPSTRPDDSFPAEPSGVTVTHTPTPPPADAPTVNYRVGRWPGLPPAPPGFELVRRLGSGGMGAVYLAKELATERTVAMKFLHAPAGPAAVDRFLVEVRALGKLDHPNIVRVLAVDTYRSDPFFTMEYAAGGSLAERVARDGPLAPVDAARLIATVARAVHAAHGQGIVHRDLKPSNILLSGAGGQDTGDNGQPSGSGPLLVPDSCPLTPKVSDFGLAKRTDRDDELTYGSGALGTPNFMPPEQTGRDRGEVGPHSDVYALGATLYHLLTGRPPFVGDSVEVLAKVQNDPPERPRALRPDVPAGLEAVVVKCLEKHPADRYASAAALADDLDRFLAGQEPDAPVLSWRRRAWRAAVRRRRRVGALALVILLMAGAFGASRLMGPVPRGAERPAPEKVVLLGATGRPKAAAWVAGESRFFDAAEADGACGFAAEDDVLLELTRDPGYDRYAVSAELRILNHRGPGKIASYAGLYCGYARAAGPDGLTAHTCMALGYYDHLTPAMLGANITEANAQIRAVAALVRPGAQPATHLAGLDARFSFPAVNAARHPAGVWRRVRFEVTPAGLAVSFATAPGDPPHPFRLVSADEINGTFRDRDTPLGRECLQRGLAPQWRPRTPVGVWCRTGAIAVRNVVIEPLP